MAREPRGRAKQLADEIDAMDDNPDEPINPADVAEPNLEGFPQDGDTFDGSEPEPEFEEVTFGDKTFRVLKTDAEALKETYESVATKEPEIVYRDPEPAPQAGEPAPQQDPDFETEFFENPGEFLQKFRNQIKAEVREELTTEYQATTQRDLFWSNFYKENPDLEGETAIVQAVMSENWESLEHEKGQQARDKLATLTKKKILALSGKMGGTQRSTEPTESLEGGGTVVRPQNVRREDKVPESLSAGIRARRAQRAQRRNLIKD